MEIKRRRTFAIISHPDAGKTTMTEKLLLYGGALQEAGAVKAKGERRRATSDFMKIEQDRGISISSTALQFEYDGKQINLLDTPGHQDFSEDTYRTIAAADNAVMLLDGAKGLEAQTLKVKTHAQDPATPARGRMLQGCFCLQNPCVASCKYTSIEYNGLTGILTAV